MNAQLQLHGYKYSVYSWIALLALREKGLASEWVEIDPFSDDWSPGFLNLHPFAQVPILVHGGFAIYETRAICGYLDEAFAGPSLQPTDAQARGRMQQIISVIDGHAYWPLVRQVFSHGVFQPSMGQPVDTKEIQDGMARAFVVLAALEDLVRGAPYLVGEALSLADIHCYPVLAYFALSPQGAEMLRGFPRLSTWFEVMKSRPFVMETTPKIKAA